MIKYDDVHRESQMQFIKQTLLKIKNEEYDGHQMQRPFFTEVDASEAAVLLADLTLKNYKTRNYSSLN